MQVKAMTSILFPNHLINMLLENTNRIPKKYKRSMFLYTIKVEKGLLIYNTLTHSLTLLQGEEIAVFEKYECSNAMILEGLIRKRIFVDADLDEIKLYKQIYNVAKNLDIKKDITLYTILTTMDCNARCFYCYEEKEPHSHMTIETAESLVNYISSHCGKKEVKLSWFGGEPLCNISVIDYICKALRQKGIKFSSIMTTNGYLFNDALITNAYKNWNLERVQITLDGTEDRYNKIKNYIYKDDLSPFKRVIKNISMLIDAGIKVVIRLNLSEENIDDIYELVNFISKQFNDKKLFYVYTGLVSNYNAIEYIWGSEHRKAMIEERNKLEKYIFELGLKNNIKPANTLQIRQCMAAYDGSTVITPDGKLCKCEHIEDGEIYGSIFTDKVNKDIIKSWSEEIEHDHKCNKCLYLPLCFHLKKCPAYKKFVCDKYEYEFKITDLKYAVLNMYNKYLIEKSV